MLSEMSDSDISWIGSVSMFFLYALAPVSGVLVDRIGPKVGLRQPRQSCRITHLR